mgnify:CR=1 FL=1
MNRKSNFIHLMAATALIVFGQSGRADPISIVGLNVSMNEAQIKNELVERGFSCSEDSSSNLICEKASEPSDSSGNNTSGMNEYEAMAALFGQIGKALGGSIAQDNQVGVSWAQADAVESIEVGCDVVGTCNYPLEQAAQMLVNSVNVDTLQSRPKQQPDATGLESITVSRYCGTGVDGDLICIESSLTGDGTGPIYLYRENFGRSKPSFK